MQCVPNCMTQVHLLVTDVTVLCSLHLHRYEMMVTGHLTFNGCEWVAISADKQTKEGKRKWHYLSL